MFPLHWWIILLTYISTLKCQQMKYIEKEYHNCLKVNLSDDGVQFKSAYFQQDEFINPFLCCKSHEDCLMGACLPSATYVREKDTGEFTQLAHCYKTTCSHYTNYRPFFFSCQTIKNNPTDAIPKSRKHFYASNFDAVSSVDNSTFCSHKEDCERSECVKFSYDTCQKDAKDDLGLCVRKVVTDVYARLNQEKNGFASIAEIYNKYQVNYTIIEDNDKFNEAIEPMTFMESIEGIDLHKPSEIIDCETHDDCELNEACVMTMFNDRVSYDRIRHMINYICVPTNSSFMSYHGERYCKMNEECDGDGYCETYCGRARKCVKVNNVDIPDVGFCMIGNEFGAFGELDELEMKERKEKIARRNKAWQFRNIVTAKCQRNVASSREGFKRKVVGEYVAEKKPQTTKPVRIISSEVIDVEKLENRNDDKLITTTTKLEETYITTLFTCKQVVNNTRIDYHLLKEQITYSKITEKQETCPPMSTCMEGFCRLAQPKPLLIDIHCQPDIVYQDARFPSIICHPDMKKIVLIHEDMITAQKCNTTADCLPNQSCLSIGKVCIYLPGERIEREEFPFRQVIPDIGDTIKKFEKENIIRKSYEQLQEEIEKMKDELFATRMLNFPKSSRDFGKTIRLIEQEYHENMKLMKELEDLVHNKFNATMLTRKRHLEIRIVDIMKKFKTRMETSYLTLTEKSSEAHNKFKAELMKEWEEHEPDRMSMKQMRRQKMESMAKLFVLQKKLRKIIFETDLSLNQLEIAYLRKALAAIPFEMDENKKLFQADVKIRMAKLELREKIFNFVEKQYINQIYPELEKIIRSIQNDNECDWKNMKSVNDLLVDVYEIERRRDLEMFHLEKSNEEAILRMEIEETTIDASLLWFEELCRYYVDCWRAPLIKYDKEMHTFKLEQLKKFIVEKPQKVLNFVKTRMEDEEMSNWNKFKEKRKQSFIKNKNIDLSRLQMDHIVYRIQAKHGLDYFGLFNEFITNGTFDRTLDNKTFDEIYLEKKREFDKTLEPSYIWEGKMKNVEEEYAEKMMKELQNLENIFDREVPRSLEFYNITVMREQKQRIQEKITEQREKYADIKKKNLEMYDEIINKRINTSFTCRQEGIKNYKKLEYKISKEEYEELEEVYLRNNKMLDLKEKYQKRAQDIINNFKNSWKNNKETWDDTLLEMNKKFDADIHRLKSQYEKLLEVKSELEMQIKNEQETIDSLDVKLKPIHEQQEQGNEGDRLRRLKLYVKQFEQGDQRQRLSQSRRLKRGIRQQRQGVQRQRNQKSRIWKKNEKLKDLHFKAIFMMAAVAGYLIFLNGFLCFDFS